MELVRQAWPSNLASILAASPNRSVVLVDLDVTLGDADVYLDMNHEYTLADLTQNVARLDSELVRRSMARHKSGLYLLPRPTELSDAGLVTEESLRRRIPAAQNILFSRACRFVESLQSAGHGGLGVL